MYQSRSTITSIEFIHSELYLVVKFFAKSEKNKFLEVTINEPMPLFSDQQKI
jgi:hypothetical protein